MSNPLRLIGIVMSGAVWGLAWSSAASAQARVTLTQDDFYIEARLRSARDEPVELVVKALVDRENGSTVWTAAVSRSEWEAATPSVAAAHTFR